MDHLEQSNLDDVQASMSASEWQPAAESELIDATDRTERRRLQNRQAQRNHRKRVRAYISSLEQQVVDNILRDLPAESGLPTPPEACMSTASEAPLEPSPSASTLSPTLSTTTVTTPPTPMTTMHSAFSPPIDYFPSQNTAASVCPTEWSPAATRGTCTSCTSCLDVPAHRTADGSMQQPECCCDCGANAMASRNYVSHYPPWQDSIMYNSSGSDSGAGMRGQFTPQLHHSSSRPKMNGIHQHFNGAQSLPTPGFGCSHTYRPHGYGSSGSPRYEQVPLMRSPAVSTSQSPPAGYGIQQIVNPDNPAYQQYALVPVSELMYLHSNRNIGHTQGMAYQMPRYGFQP